MSESNVDRNSRTPRRLFTWLKM